jgi:hypothetical protein
MVRQPETGKHRRTRLFVFTLGHSRKSIRLISFRSSSRIWAELHERAFRRLGGAPRVVVLDNRREGVIKPDFYDPTLNPLYADVSPPRRPPRTATPTANAPAWRWFRPAATGARAERRRMWRRLRAHRVLSCPPGIGSLGPGVRVITAVTTRSLCGGT